MKKRILSVTVVILSVAALLFLAQFSKDPDIINSRAESSENYLEEHISVVMNKMYVSDYNKAAEEIVQKCRDNDFENIRFSYDLGKPNALYGTVYLNRFSFNNGKALFSFEFVQQDVNGGYNIVDDPDRFTLKIKTNE